MILLTDGVNNRGAIDPRTARTRRGCVRDQDLHHRRRHRGHGAGAGGARAVRPALRESAGARSTKPLLTDVANITGGRYFRARDAAALQRIYEQIDQLERVPVQTRSYVQLHGAVSLAALGLALAELAPRAGSGRVEGAAAVTVDYPWLLLLALVLPAARGRGAACAPTAAPGAPDRGSATSTWCRASFRRTRHAARAGERHAWPARVRWSASRSPGRGGATSTPWIGPARHRHGAGARRLDLHVAPPTSSPAGWSA